MEGTKHLESLVRAIRSTGPKELLLKLAVNRADLQQQLHAVLIQAVYRGHRGRQRVRLLRRRWTIFNRTTEDVSNIMLEQFIIQTSLDLAINFHRVNARYHRLRENLEESMTLEMECLVEEVLQEESRKVTEEVLLNVSELLLNVRKRQQLLSQQQQMLATENDLLARDYLVETSNPIIGVLVMLLKEECYSVTIETLLETSRLQLIESHSQRITPLLIDEVIYVETLRTLLNEFSFIEEKEFMAQTISLIEKQEIKDCVLCDRSVRFLKRQREQLTHNLLHSNDIDIDNDSVFNEKNHQEQKAEEFFSETAATLVSQNVSQAMITALLKRHETQFDPLISALSIIVKVDVSQQDVSSSSKYETAPSLSQKTVSNSQNPIDEDCSHTNDSLVNIHTSDANRADNVSDKNRLDGSNMTQSEKVSRVGVASRESAVDKLRRLTSMSHPSSTATSPRLDSFVANRSDKVRNNVVDLRDTDKIAALLTLAQDLEVDSD